MIMTVPVFTNPSCCRTFRQYLVAPYLTHTSHKIGHRWLHSLLRFHHDLRCAYLCNNPFPAHQLDSPATTKFSLERGKMLVHIFNGYPLNTAHRRHILTNCVRRPHNGNPTPVGSAAPAASPPPATHSPPPASAPGHP